MAEDPCDRAERLRTAKDEIILGDKAVEVEHDSGVGEKRRVKYGQANLGALDREIVKAERECALKQGRPTRFAMTGG